MSFEEKNVGQFKCQSCGGALELSSKRTKYVSCPYCGSVADASTDAYKILTKGENPDKFKPRSFMKLGMQGNFDGKEFKVIGRTCWKNNYKEYWDEDGETGYSNETWNFEEWLLLGEDGDYKSIICDDDGHAFAESFVPKYPSIPEGTQANNFNNNSNERVQEYGKSEILYFEGESTYLVKPGNVVSFSQYNDGDFDYIAEWRFFDNGEIKEVEYFKETEVSVRELKQAFRIEEKEIKVSGKKEIDPIKKRNKRIWAFAGLFNILISIVIGFYYAGDYGKDLYNFSYTVQQLETQTKWGKTSDTTKAIAVQSPKKFEITKDLEEIIIRINFKVPETNFEGTYTVYFFDKNNNVVFEISEFNYNYKYYKNTGYGAKRTGSKYSNYNVKDMQGEYTLMLHFEVPINYKVSSLEPIETSLNISEVKRQWDGGVFLFFGIFMLIISLFIKKRK